MQPVTAGSVPPLAQDRGPVPAGLQVSFLLLLKDPTSARQAADLDALYTPRTPLFGRFMSPSRLAAYGPSPGAVQRVAAFLRRAGLSARWRRGNDWIAVAGPAQRVERTFGVPIHVFTDSHGLFYAGLRNPSIPTALRPVVAGASRITNGLVLRPQAVPAGGLAPSNLLAAYDISPLRKLGLDGSGMTIVFYEIDGFTQANLDTYTRRFHLPALHPVLKAGPRLSPQGETEMDLEVAHAIAPGARLVIYTQDQSAGAHAASSGQDFLNTLVSFQDRIVRENPHAVISESVGACEQGLGATGAQAYAGVFSRADALGESVFASSGDSAAFGCLDAAQQGGTAPSSAAIGVAVPAAIPGITAVGGTRLSVRTNGSWYDETAWEDPTETAGTGGGLSAYFARPSWQQGPGVPSGHQRAVPDVAADADPASGATIVSGQKLQQGGGTSQAAPIWAAITVLIDQYLHRQGLGPVGFMNPALYRLAATRQAYAPFHDVTRGSNLVYSAGRGYDMATGLGTPDAWNLARDLAAYEKAGRP